MEETIGVKKKYTLELHWERVRYKSNFVVLLEKAYFAGAALSNADRINNNDMIVLDFSRAYYLFIPSFYLANLRWKSVEYLGNIVLLGDVTIEGDKAIVVPKLKDTDYIIIDTSKHERNVHPFNLTYDAFVVNSLGEVYRF